MTTFEAFDHEIRERNAQAQQMRAVLAFYRAVAIVFLGAGGALLLAKLAF